MRSVGWNYAYRYYALYPSWTFRSHSPPIQSQSPLELGIRLEVGARLVGTEILRSAINTRSLVVTTGHCETYVDTHASSRCFRTNVRRPYHMCNTDFDCGVYKSDTANTIWTSSQTLVHVGPLLERLPWGGFLES